MSQLKALHLSQGTLIGVLVVDIVAAQNQIRGLNHCFSMAVRRLEPQQGGDPKGSGQNCLDDGNLKVIWYEC